MSAKLGETRRCIVCGRNFPEGQGIVLKIAEISLEFHSSRCFSKFAKNLFERVPPDDIKDYLKRLIEEYNELLEQRKKAKAKKI
ncbi:MAG: hypothetical protein QXU13_00195 [Desulfurococcaceae archaeon]